MTEASTKPFTHDPATQRRAARAGFVGSVIEYYDFLVYAFLATTIGPLFFPSANPTTSLLAILAAYGAGYLARPLGAVFFGWFGDRRGRKDALMLTVVGMGAATCLLGLIPTYAQAGVLGPILLVFARCVQGFSAGGELMGASTYVAESSQVSRRGFFISLSPMGGGAGAALAPVVVGVVSLLLPAEQMAAWGWRIPFLISLPLIVLALVMRARLEDTPEFQTMADRGRIVRFPLGKVLREHRSAVLRTTVLSITVNASAFLVTSYLNIYLIAEVGLPKSTVYWLSALVLLCALPGYLVGGWATDRFGTRRVAIACYASCLVLAYPVMAVMGAGGGFVVTALAYLVFAFVNNVSQAPTFATIVHAFPGRVRYTGTSVGFNVGGILIGGFGPYFAGLLTAGTGNPLSPAFIVIGAGILGIVVMATFSGAIGVEAARAAQVAAPPAQLEESAS
ncbi:MFS transporter [Rhodococcus sp. WS4]|nr:MFS transporter [Rhodococcus sp. WS4]